MAAILEGDLKAKASIRNAKNRVTSALTISEASRAILRAFLAKRVSLQHRQKLSRTLNRFAKRCNLIDIDSRILARAGRRFPLEAVRTLDAIHLASMESMEKPPEFVVAVTREAWVRDNAIALGYRVE